MAKNEYSIKDLKEIASLFRMRKLTDLKKDELVNLLDKYNLYEPLDSKLMTGDEILQNKKIKPLLDLLQYASTDPKKYGVMITAGSYSMILWGRHGGSGQFGKFRIAWTRPLGGIKTSNEPDVWGRPGGDDFGSFTDPETLVEMCRQAWHLHAEKSTKKKANQGKKQATVGEKKYVVYIYRYAEMKKPMMDAKLYKGKETLDTLPPTIIDHVIVEGSSKQNAILKSKFWRQHVQGIETGKKKGNKTTDTSEVKGFSATNEPGDVVIMELKDLVDYLTNNSEDGFDFDFFMDEDIVLKAGLIRKVKGAKKPKNVDEHVEESTGLIELVKEIEDFEGKPGQFFEINDDVAEVYADNPNAFNFWEILQDYFDTWAFDDREKGEKFVHKKGIALANKIKQFNG